MSFKTWFESMWNKFLSDAEDFMSNLTHQIAATGGPLIIQIVIDAVSAAESQGGSGSDKLAAALAAAQASAVKNGITASENLLRGMIEAEVANMKSAQGVTPSATAMPASQ